MTVQDILRALYYLKQTVGTGSTSAVEFIDEENNIYTPIKIQLVPASFDSTIRITSRKHRN